MCSVPQNNRWSLHKTPTVCHLCVLAIVDTFSFVDGSLDSSCWNLLAVNEDEKTSDHGFILLIIGVYQRVTHNYTIYHHVASFFFWPFIDCRRPSQVSQAKD